MEDENKNFKSLFIAIIILVSVHIITSGVLSYVYCHNKMVKTCIGWFLSLLMCIAILVISAIEITKKTIDINSKSSKIIHPFTVAPKCNSEWKQSTYEELDGKSLQEPGDYPIGFPVIPSDTKVHICTDITTHDSPPVGSGKYGLIWFETPSLSSTFSVSQQKKFNNMINYFPLECNDVNNTKHRCLPLIIDKSNQAVSTIGQLTFNLNNLPN